MSSLVCPKCGTLSVGRSKDEDGLRARIAELEAALAERDGMLRMAEELVLKVLPTFSPTTAKLIRKVFADIRARAEGGGGP